MTSRDYDNLYYVYFGYITSRDKIVILISKYTSEFEEITPIGYNYKEYKIWVKNPGGLMNEIDDYGGYIRKERESGFLDGAPNQGIIDHTIKKSDTHIISSSIKQLHLYQPDRNIEIKQLMARDAAGAHKIDFKFSSNQNVLHYVNTAYDSEITELIHYDQEIVDDSDVDSYKVVCDFDNDYKNITVNSPSSTDVTNQANIYDGDESTYGLFTTAGSSAWACYLDGGSNINLRNIYLILESGGISTDLVFYYIKSPVARINHDTITIPASGKYYYCPFRSSDIYSPVSIIGFDTLSQNNLKMYELLICGKSL